MTVHVTGYDRPRVRIVEAPIITPAQLERRRLWLAASPGLLAAGGVASAAPAP